jgi:hypothetical protein
VTCCWQTISGAPEPAAVSVPVACALDGPSLAGRLEEWRALVASSTVSLDADATSVRLVLDGSDVVLAAAASLGQREKQCCPFFEVGIELGPDARTLYLRVPPEAAGAMAAFVEMLRS